MAEKKKANPVKKVTSKIKKSVKKEVKPRLFEDKSDLESLYLYTIIVEQTVANTVIKLLQNIGSSAQFVHNGRGTAPSEVLGMLGATEDKKAIINAFIGEDKLKIVEEELSIFFKISKKNRGVGFAVPLSSIQGIRMYKYLTQTI